MSLITTPNLADPDAAYAALLAAHKGLPEAESTALNARLVLILMNTPRSIWSCSIDSNSARKLPSPKPSSPLRWMNSKKIGPITVFEKICSRMLRLAAIDHAFAVDQDAVLFHPVQRFVMAATRVFDAS
jgi:hypothetical protein